MMRTGVLALMLGVCTVFSAHAAELGEIERFYGSFAGSRVIDTRDSN